VAGTTVWSNMEAHVYCGFSQLDKRFQTCGRYACVMVRVLVNKPHASIHRPRQWWVGIELSAFVHSSTSAAADVYLLTDFNVSFFFVPWGGVRLSPLGTSATVWPIAPAPDDRWWSSVE
jgi:hypothetical protein